MSDQDRPRAAANFARIDHDADHPLPVLVVGAGAMSRAWLDAVDRVQTTTLAGIVDLDLDAARTAATDVGRPDLPVGDDLVVLADETGAGAVVDVTTPEAHHAITATALGAGLPVLGEKPVAATLREALSLVATATATGQLFMVSQSRRWNPHVFDLRRLAARIAPVGTVSIEFFRAPHFGGFRETMDDPLLVDMAIHAFDTIRFVLADEPATVTADSWDPPWSWYDGDAAATASFTMAGGGRAVWTGSWCAPGHETSWNGQWRLSGAGGSVTWDGDHGPVLDPGDDTPSDGPDDGPDDGPHDGPDDTPDDTGHREFAAALATFSEALRTGIAPNGDVRENVRSMAMVAAAVTAARTGAAVHVDDLLADAHGAALAAERRDDARSVLAGWEHPREVLTTWGG